MGRKNKVTMQRIADLAGVSKATVSNALSGKKGMMSEEIRQKIIRTADGLGYRKINHLIRFIVIERDEIIFGNRIDDNEKFIQMRMAMEAECAAHGWQLRVNHISRSERDHGFQYVQDLSDCDGMIILGWELEAQDLGWLRSFLTVPFVIVDASFSTPEYDFVAGNHADASCKLTEAMIRAGHRRIGYIHGGRLDVYRERFSGYRSALYAHNLEFDRSLVCTVERTGSSVFVDEIREFLIRVSKRSTPAPTAFLCSDDRIAVSLMAAARALGMTFAVAGFDNLPLCIEQTPSLASAEMDYGYNGRVAAARMIDKIEQNDARTQKIYTEIKVCLRESISSEQN